MRRRNKAITVAAVTAVVGTAVLLGCHPKGPAATGTAAPQKGMYTDFLTITVRPMLQENDVLDLEIDLGMKWEAALKSLNIVERPGDDFWIGLALTKITFANAKGDVVQEVDFSGTSLDTLRAAAADCNANPQLYDRITYYKGGFSENYGSPATRRDDATAEIHFPIYKELGHRKGTLKIYGYLFVPPHYENKKGEAGIYVQIGGKNYEGGLLRELPVALTGNEKVPVYSERRATATPTTTTAQVETKPLGTLLETVTVIPEGGLKLRDGPAFDAKTLEIIPRGTKLDVYEKSGEWYKVRTPAGHLGWAKSVNEGEVLLD